MLVEQVDVDGLEALTDAEEKISITISATRIEKATLISTTNGMPLAAVAARISPFSIDMKPITWLTALRREIIRQKPEQDDRQRERQVFARQRAGLLGDRQHHHDRQRDQADAGQHSQPGADYRFGWMVRWMPRRITMRCSASGMTTA